MKKAFMRKEVVITGEGGVIVGVVHTKRKVLGFGILKQKWGCKRPIQNTFVYSELDFLEYNRAQ